MLVELAHGELRGAREEAVREAEALEERQVRVALFLGGLRGLRSARVRPASVGVGRIVACVEINQ